MKAEKELIENILLAAHRYENSKLKKGTHIIIKIVRVEKGSWYSSKEQFMDTKKAIKYLQDEDLK